MNNDDIREYLKPRHEHFLKIMPECANFMALISSDFLKDPLCMMDIGGAVVMDKPMVFVIIKGAKIGKKMRLIADKIIELPDETIESMRAARQEIDKFMREHDLIKS